MEAGKKYFSVASGGGRRTLHPDNGSRTGFLRND
ncbi:MAG: GGGtGRT protein [Waltera sp.]